MKNMTYEVDHDGIAVITWDMLNKSVNVLSMEAQQEFNSYIVKAQNDDAVKGIIVTSAKSSFIAGADLDEMGSSSSKSGSAKLPKNEIAARIIEACDNFHQIMRTLEQGGKPVVAAINGTALGGGLEVALACHHRIATDNPKALIGLPEAKFGLLPGGGGTQRLPRIIGAANALPLMLEAKQLSPSKAHALGIIEQIVPQDQLLATAKALITSGKARHIQPWNEKKFKVPGGKPTDKGAGHVYVVGNAMLRKLTYGNYSAQLYIQRCVFEGLMVPFDKGLRVESRYFAKLLMSPTTKNMIRSLFQSSQELSKGAHRPSHIEKSNCETVGVLGAGMMGAGIAYSSAKAGINVILLDSSLENAEKGKAYSTKLLDKAIERGKTTENKKTELLNRIKPTTDYADLAPCDLIIEAVFEDRSVKADVTVQAEQAISENCIIASNTSTLPITSLAEASSRPEDFIGLHFFSPVDKMQLVEVIKGKQTGEKALAVALDYVAKIRKIPIVVNDSRGFYTSRCVGYYISEAVNMLGEGIKPALIENAGKMAGMPVSPLSLNDEVSLELSNKIREATEKDLGANYKQSDGDRLIKQMVEEYGKLGKKAKKGFYDYPEGAKKRLWPELSNIVKVADQQPDVEELKKRFLYIQALQTARCFEEGVLTDVRDADIGAIFGWGFAPFTGGPLSFIDTTGTAKFVEECDQLAEKYGDRYKPTPLLREMAEKNETFYKRFNPKKLAS